MSDWYRKVTASYEKIPDMLVYFENELANARGELKMSGRTLEQHAARMPGITEHRFTQLQEVDAILEYMEMDMKKLRSKKFRHYLHGYEKALTSRDAEKYIDGDDEVVDLALLTNEVALLRNKYLSFHKGLEAKHWQLSNVVKLRCAGLEDVTVN